MLLIPAIDLKDGQCVRLKQGDMAQSTVFSDNPGEMARHWLEQGARRLHIVDLNGAFAGEPVNRDAIFSILQAVQDFSIENDYIDIPVQIGGGIRDLETIENYLDAGISSVIIGTAAVKDPDFVLEACKVFPGHVMVGLDARDGKVAIDGWSTITEHDVITFSKTLEEYGVQAIIYTDIGRDGMMGGVNVEATVKLAQAVDLPIIASGGLHNIADVEALCAVQHEGIVAVICGRSIYEGSLDLQEGQLLADTLTYSCSTCG